MDIKTQERLKENSVQVCYKMFQDRGYHNIEIIATKTNKFIIGFYEKEFKYDSHITDKKKFMLAMFSVFNDKKLKDESIIELYADFVTEIFTNHNKRFPQINLLKKNEQQTSINNFIFDVSLFYIYNKQKSGKTDIIYKNEFENENKQNIYFFDMRKWSHNPIEHELQPEFTLYKKKYNYCLTCEKNKSIEEQPCQNSDHDFLPCSFKRTNLPEMCINDPVAKYYNSSIHDIFMIKRKDENIGFRNVTQRQINLHKDG